MSRSTIFVLSCALLGTLLLAVAVAQRPSKPAKFSSKQLVVTNIDPASLRYLGDGTFTAKGAPSLHAVMPMKHMTLDAAGLDGHVDVPTGSLKDAVLSGG